ncbi:MAG: hypothetical protein U0840_05390 [Gemmataceae bacterium]
MNIPVETRGVSPHAPVDEVRLFQRLRLALLRNSWKQMRTHSLVRPLTILASSLIVVVFVFLLSFGGFRFFIEVMQMPAHGLIIELLVGLLFFSLGVLLIFSGGLILHGSLFSAAETAFLLSKPVSADQVFAYKFQGAVAFSSWAFLLLGGPLLIAYGIVAGCPWYFYASLPLFFLGFVLLPGSLGAILCFLMVNYVPRQRKQLLALLVAAITLILGWWIYRTAVENRSLSLSPEPMSEAATQLLSRISFARSLWMPSGWVARGVMAAARGDLPGMGYYLALVWTNGLMLYLVAAGCARFLYRRGFNRISTGGDLRRKHGGVWMDRLLAACLPFVPFSTRLLIVKDFRTFRRDPQQFGQVVLYTLILVLYFTNIKRMFVRDIEWPYQNGISLLNFSSIALFLCAYTGRFIYPLLSLEGRKFWILGLLPLERDQLLWGKFAFSLAGSVLISMAMVVLSDLMLAMPLSVMAVHLLTMLVLAAGLSALSVGIGALMPNFRESDPSKIAVGFGGTLNLVVCLGYLVVIIGLMAGPWHVFHATVQSPDDMRSAYFLPAVCFGLLAGLVLGLATVFIVLRMGIESLRRLEF